MLATAPIIRYRRVKTSQEAARRETAVVRPTGELLSASGLLSSVA